MHDSTSSSSHHRYIFINKIIQLIISMYNLVHKLIQFLILKKYHGVRMINIK